MKYKVGDEGYSKNCIHNNYKIRIVGIDRGIIYYIFVEDSDKDTRHCNENGFILLTKKEKKDLDRRKRISKISRNIKEYTEDIEQLKEELSSLQKENE